MWSTNSLWFEVAIVSIIYAIGNIFFGHFGEPTPKFRRIGKYVLMLIIVCLISFYLGRTIAMSFLASFLIQLECVHGYILPRKKGIYGWPGEKQVLRVQGLGQEYIQGQVKAALSLLSEYTLQCYELWVMSYELPD